MRTVELLLAHTTKAPSKKIRQARHTAYHKDTCVCMCVCDTDVLMNKFKYAYRMEDTNKPQ
jgi:adenosylmethionine-8-amino-7-oxononanoate aminotransferase